MNRLNHQRRDSQTRTAEPETPAETNETFACSDCQTNDVTRTSDGEVICSECSVILSDNEIDRGPDWRAFNANQQQERSHVGSPVTEAMHDKGLTTNISWQNRDSNGQSLSKRKRRQMNRLRTRQDHAKTKDARERNLRQAFGEIDRMASALGVPKSVREISCVIYRRAHDDDLIRGRSIEGMASAALYAGCRQASIPRGLGDVATVSRVDELEISRAYRHTVRELSLEIEPVSAKEHIPRFCSDLNVSNELEQKATEIVDITSEAGLASGKSPTGFAAAAIYTASLLCNEEITQREISEVANTTEVTIRNRYREQMEIIEDTD